MEMLGPAFRVHVHRNWVLGIVVMATVVCLQGKYLSMQHRDPYGTTFRQIGQDIGPLIWVHLQLWALFEIPCTLRPKKVPETGQLSIRSWERVAAWGGTPQP